MDQNEDDEEDDKKEEWAVWEVAAIYKCLLGVHVHTFLEENV